MVSKSEPLQKTSRWMPRAIIGMLALLLTISVVSPTLAQKMKLFRIGTGGRTGVYYPIGRLIAQAVTGDQAATGMIGYVGVAQNSAGSVANALAVAAGEIEAGLVQADVAAWAVHSENMFEGNASAASIRAIASLYPEKFQIVVRRDAGIRQFEDLRGQRISVDEIGSGTLSVMRIALQAHDMSEHDFSPVYLKPVFTSDKFINGDLQGFVMMAGAPMHAATHLVPAGISLVPIAPEIAARIAAQHPYLVPGRIAAGTYAGIPEIPTIEVYALLVVHQNLPDSFVYQLTATLWDQRTLDLLKEGHPQGRAITPGSALAGLSIPLHPGAEAYYRSHRVRFKDVPTQ